MLDSLIRAQRLVQRVTALMPQQSQVVPVDVSAWRRRAIELVPWITPAFERPDHLSLYGDQLDRVASGLAFRVAIAAPPQHGKSELTIRWLIQQMVLNPGKRYVYATYNQTRANEVAADAWRIASDMGLSPTKAKGAWSIFNGAAIKFTSVGGSLTGFAVTGGIVIDDPIKDMQEAESVTIRERIWKWYLSVVNVRVHEAVGAFTIIMATRWHADDLTGRCVDRLGIQYVNIQAICEDEKDGTGRKLGEALWESRWSRITLEKRRDADPYIFAALCQGNPRSRGARLFSAPLFYDDIPVGGYSVLWGLDLAYSKTTRSDYSVAICAKVHKGVAYVTNIIRVRASAPEFGELLKEGMRYSQGPALWLCSGTEKGTFQFLESVVPSVEARNATGDKFARAQPAARLWNEGKILLPSQASWLSAFVEEVTGFTGVNDARDDQVDALAAIGVQMDSVVADMKPAEEVASQLRAVSQARWGSRASRGFG